MVCYQYKNINDYLSHVRELIKQGYNWTYLKKEEEYKRLFGHYENFVLYVGKTTESLSYGSREMAEIEDFNIILYSSKKNNLVNY